MLLAPVDRGAIFLGKAIANFLFIVAMEVVTLPLFVILFNVPLEWFPVTAVHSDGHGRFCGSWNFALGNCRVHPNARGDAAGVVISGPGPAPDCFGKNHPGRGLQDVPFSDYQGWFNLLLAYDLIFATLAFLVFEYIVEE